MKKILVPTDFSKTAANAMNYAVELAKRVDAKIILFHVFDMPLIATDVPVWVPSIDELGENNLARLEKLKSAIARKHGALPKVECHCKLGLITADIQRYAADKKVDLIVMGTQGVNYDAVKIFGNTTTAVMLDAPCPVLSIDKRVKFKPLNNILFAVDYVDKHSRTFLKVLKELAGIFGSRVSLLNVLPEIAPITSPREDKSVVKLHRMLKEVPHSFHQTSNESVTDGINDFVRKKNMDMVVMIQRHHPFLTGLFKRPSTRKVAFHTRLPLLVLQP